MTYIWKQKTLNTSLFKNLSTTIKDNLTCTIASVRDYGIKNIHDFNSFINNNLNDLQYPDIIPNINEIVDIFTNPPETVYIFGDYDVDGTFSSFMLKNILYSGGCKDVNFYISHRKTDGYGLNKKSIWNFLDVIESKPVGMVVFLDCGTNSKEEIAILKEKHNNPYVVVIDHHIVDEENFASNADVIINNRLAENVPPYSTGGLIYQIAKKLDGKLKFNPDKLLPYAAITTIADVSPLYGDNRIIVANGLKQMNAVKNHGLIELMRVSGVDPENCSVEDVSFKLGPRINANGRIEHAKKVINLLNEKNEDEAFGLALEMDALNENRKKLQKKMVEYATKEIGDNLQKQSILIYNDKWEIGIVGIVASKLTDKYSVPSLVFGNHDNKIKGSARSVKGINIKEVMDKVSYIFETYGGHEMAAGATLKEEYAKEAHNIFNKAIVEYKEQNNIKEEPIEYDILLKTNTFKTINDDFCDKIQKFGPFGQENKKILFRTNNIKCKSINEWGSGSGAFVAFDGLDFDCFIYESNAKEKLQDKTIDILFEIGENFKDDKKWAIIISKVKESTYTPEPIKENTAQKNLNTEELKEIMENTKYYAGIGSRSTPDDIQDLMTKIAEHFKVKGYVLRSGGAEGADSAFEKGAGDQKEIFLPWPNFQDNKSIYDGENWKYKKIHLKLAEKHHPNFQYLKYAVKRLMIRNSAQIIGKDSQDTPSQFVVCYTKDGKASGGTGQAIRLAQSIGIPVYNLYDKEIQEKFKKELQEKGRSSLPLP